jgi:hypothetical protein
MDIELPPFVSSLLEVANKIRATKKLPVSQDTSDAAVLVVADLLANTVPPKSFATAATAPQLSNSIGALLCFVVSSIVIRAKKDGYDIPKNEVLAAAFLALYQMHDRDTIVRLMTDGVRHYWSLVESAPKSSSMQEYIDILNRTVVLYVMTGDESLKDQVSYLYALMVQAQNVRL